MAKRTSYEAEVVATPPPVAGGVAATLPGAVEGFPMAPGGAPIFDPGGAIETPFAGAGPCDPCGPCDDACGFGDCGFDPCAPPPVGRWSFRGDYLLWWTKSSNLPPLVTTSPEGTDQGEAGILGEPGTTVLFGGDGADVGSHSGARFTLGFSVDPNQQVGIEATYFFLGERSVTFNRTSLDGDPILARPFFNVDTGSARAFQQDVVLVAFPNVAIDSRLNADVTRDLQSFDLVAREAMYCEAGGRIDLLYGYRYGRFAERLAIDQVFTAENSPPLADDTVLQSSDVFAAGNEFHGVEAGMAAQAQYFRWSFEGLAKVALGGTRSRATVNGSTTVTVPDAAPVTTEGGLLAQSTNIGSYSQSNFTAIPEIGLTAGVDITPRVKATLGYSLVYWSRVARPADQIDAGRVAGDANDHINVNPTQFSGGQLVGMPSPQFRFITSDFWAQGLSFGLDCRF